MKNQGNQNNSQGNTTADRNFTDHKETQKQQGISNGGGQRSDQTSNKDNDRGQRGKKS
jgi:hypothetical protein